MSLKNKLLSNLLLVFGGAHKHCSGIMPSFSLVGDIIFVTILILCCVAIVIWIIRTTAQISTNCIIQKQWILVKEAEFVSLPSLNIGCSRRMRAMFSLSIVKSTSGNDHEWCGNCVTGLIWSHNCVLHSRLYNVSEHGVKTCVHQSVGPGWY